MWKGGVGGGDVGSGVGLGGEGGAGVEAGSDLLAPLQSGEKAWPVAGEIVEVMGMGLGLAGAGVGVGVGVSVHSAPVGWGKRPGLRIYSSGPPGREGEALRMRRVARMKMMLPSFDKERESALSPLYHG